MGKAPREGGGRKETMGKHQIAITLPTDCPCYGCGERSAGCHDACGRYASYRSELDRLREEAARRRASGGIGRWPEGRKGR